METNLSKTNGSKAADPAIILPHGAPQDPDGTITTGTTSGNQSTLVGTPVDSSAPPNPSNGPSSSQTSQHRSGQSSHHPRHSHQTLPLPESSKSNLSRLLSGSGSCLLSTGVSDNRLNVGLSESKIVTPRRQPRTNIKGLPLENVTSKRGRLFARHSVDVTSNLQKERQCDQHCFLSDVADVRQMEQGLLQLLDNFHSGKLQAFGQDCTLEKMEQVREQQDRLARLHFDLNTRQELIGPQSNEGRQMAKENLPKLIDSLQQLSLSIEQLQSASPGVQTEV